MKQQEARAWCGVIGPTGFVAAWATAGPLTKGYSPVQEAISHLAALRAPTRWLMTAGFVCFGVAVPVYSSALRNSLGGRAWLAAATTGIATLGAGAFPLDISPTTDRVHRGFAVIASSSLALTPVLAGQTLSACGHGRAAAASRLVGAMSGGCLVASAFVPTEGLFQRIGLTLSDGWLAASAVAILRVMEPTRVSPAERLRSAPVF